MSFSDKSGCIIIKGPVAVFPMLTFVVTIVYSRDPGCSTQISDNLKRKSMQYNMNGILLDNNSWGGGGVGGGGIGDGDLGLLSLGTSYLLLKIWMTLLALLLSMKKQNIPVANSI